MKSALFRHPLLLALTCLLLACGGCGKKGPVKPLKQALPAAPAQLTAFQQGNLMQIAWEIPTRNQDGSALDDLQGFSIFKMRYNLAEDCPECRDMSTLLRQVDMDFLKNAERLGNHLSIWDNNLEAGYGYQYRVVAYTRNNRKGAPAVIRHPFLPPIAPPTNLKASGHDRMVRLSWQPPAVGGGIRILGYTIYRRSAGAAPAAFPLNSQLVGEPAFEDYGLPNGATYVYTVRMVVESGGIRLESTASAPVEAIPEAGK